MAAITTTTTLTTAEIDHFLQDSLVLWASAFLHQTQPISSYNTFVDGAIFVDILSEIEPELPFSKFDFSSLKLQNSSSSRLKIFSFVIKSILKIYEELGVQAICVPDAVCLANEPCTKFGLENMKLLLMLLLDSSVKCDRKEFFINKISTLPCEVQMKLANSIVELSNIKPCMVMEREKIDELPVITAFFRERDNYIQNREFDAVESTSAANTSISESSINADRTLTTDNDLRSKLNKLKKELDEKSDYISELNVKFDRISRQAQKLHLENEDLKTRVRKNSLYRDEADAMREKAGQVDDLDKQVKFLRKQIEKMSSLEMKNKELLGDNQLLTEAKSNLENEIASLEKKTANSLKYQMELMDVKLEVEKLIEINESTKQKLNEMVEENIELNKRLNDHSLTIGAAAAASIEDGDDDDDDDENNANGTINESLRPGEQNLSDQLLQKNQKEIARLELDNRKLMYENKQINEDNQKLNKQLQNTSENLESLKAEKIELIKSKSELKKQLTEMQTRMKSGSSAWKVDEGNNGEQQQQQQQLIANLEIELKEQKIQNSNLQKDLFDERFKIKRISEFLIKFKKSEYGLKSANGANDVGGDGVCNDDGDDVGNDDDTDDVFAKDRNVDEIIEKLSERKFLYDSHSGNLLDEIKVLQHKLDSQRNTFDLVKNQLNVEKDELYEQLQKAQKKLQNSNFDLSLKKKYEDLQIEYDQLLKTKEVLKVENRDWKLQVERLQNEHEYLKNENFSLKNEKSLNDIHRQSFTDIKSDNSRLKDDFQKLLESNVTLSNELCDTKTSLKDALAEHNKCKKQLMRVSKDYQAILFYNSKLEEVRDGCMNLVNHIMLQHHELLSCTMSDKDRYNEYICDFSNQLAELKQKKQSLETKLMQCYQNMNNSTVVKKSTSAKCIDYFRKWNFLHSEKTVDLNVPETINDSMSVQSQPQQQPQLQSTQIERYASLPDNCNQSIDYANGNRFGNRAGRSNVPNENNSCLGSVRSRRGVYISDKDGGAAVACSRSHSSSNSSLSSPQHANGNYETTTNGFAESPNNQNAPLATDSPSSIMYVKVANTYNNGNGSGPHAATIQNVNSMHSQHVSSARRTIDEPHLRYAPNSQPQPDQSHYYPHPDNNYGEKWFEFGVI